MDLLIETVNGHSLSICQTGLSSGIGGVVWDCGFVLSKLLLMPKFVNDLKNRLQQNSGSDSLKAFELGSGTGLVSMQLAMLGFQVSDLLMPAISLFDAFGLWPKPNVPHSQVVATDLPGVIPQLAINLTQNSHLLSDCSIVADVYIWGQQLPEHHFPVDLLVLSDCLYAFEYIELLTESLRDIFLRCGHSPVILHAYEDRNAEIPAQFFQRVAAFLSWEELTISDFLQEDQLPPDVKLLIMWRRREESDHTEQA